jgi:flagella basal body P-ring formation protein FlgA
VAQTLAVMNDIVVSGPDVLLKDLVQQPSTLPEQWGERVVVPAPEPGQSQDYALASIAYALQRYPDMRAVTLRGHLRLSVERPGQAVDVARLEKAVEDFIDEAPDWPNPMSRVEFERVRKKIMVPLGEVEVMVEDYSLDQDRQTTCFEVSVMVDGLPVCMVPMRARLVAMQEVWVAARPLQRGQVLSLDDLEVRLVPEDTTRKKYVPVHESITGLEISRPLKMNQPLRHYYLRSPICADRGDWINVVHRRKGLSVTMRARALGRGRRGDRILCMNERSKRRVLVSLVDSGEGIIEQ